MKVPHARLHVRRWSRRSDRPSTRRLVHLALLRRYDGTPAGVDGTPEEQRFTGKRDTRSARLVDGALQTHPALLPLASS